MRISYSYSTSYAYSILPPTPLNILGMIALVSTINGVLWYLKRKYLKQPPSPTIPPPKAPTQSQMEMTQSLLPIHADVYGVAYSGQIMGWIDICAGLAAKSHANMPCVTASVDAVHFIRPLFVGDIIIIRASVNRSWRSSMEVGVSVVAEDQATGDRRYCCRAYLTFVALKEGRPFPVPLLVPVSEHEWEEYQAAAERRSQRVSDRSLNAVPEDLVGDGKAIGPNFVQVMPRQGAQGGDGRPSSVSYTQSMTLIMPQHANSIGITFGGHIIKLMEEAAVIAASRHTHLFHRQQPTSLVFRAVSIDTLNFLNPTKVGDIVAVRAYVSRVFHSTIEVYITVHARALGYNDQSDDSGEDLMKFTNDAYMTFMAVGKDVDLKLFDEDFGLQSPITQVRGKGQVKKASELPQVIPEVPLEQWRYENAEKRREARLFEKTKILKTADQICAFFSSEEKQTI